MQKKECIAMLLAGGQGSRLGLLTRNLAKPAVSFGGKYRIIDFSLSNCVNSGIDTVGVLIQYRPMVLSRYLGTGEAWDLDAADGGVHVLPPYATENGGFWYEGTADAIYRNMRFIGNYDPEYILILSGDHLYSMDYNQMLETHKATGADLTVAVREVPWAEASRFGIMSVDEQGRITRFAEKPKQPESNLASMGIYIFTWKVLKDALERDHEDPNTERDFGKNIIPMLLGEGKKLQAYHFDGFWKDVGTVDSYYDAQMDLLSDNPEFDIYHSEDPIYSNSNIYPAHRIGPDAEVDDAIICNGAVIEGTVTHSIIGSGARIGRGAKIIDSIVLPGAVVGDGTAIKSAIVNENAVIGGGLSIGGAEGTISVAGSDGEIAVFER